MRPTFLGCDWMQWKSGTAAGGSFLEIHCVVNDSECSVNTQVHGATIIGRQRSRHISFRRYRNSLINKELEWQTSRSMLDLIKLRAPTQSWPSYKKKKLARAIGTQVTWPRLPLNPNGSIPSFGIWWERNTWTKKISIYTAALGILKVQSWSCIGLHNWQQWRLHWRWKVLWR